MERPIIVPVAGDYAGEIEVESLPMGAGNWWNRDRDISFLHRRFQGYCPYHILHNLLNLHYGRDEACTANPFTNEQCRHGSHERPCLSAEDMRAYAPAEGALIHLPFALSYRAGNGELVAGCADCEYLRDGETCGACHRMWNGGQPVPAAAFSNQGRCARLNGWRSVVGLGGQDVGEGDQEAEEEGQEFEEEEYEEEHEENEEEYEEEYEEEEYKEEYEEEDQEGGQEEWDGEEEQGGRGPSWGDGRWIPDSQGGYKWVVDFPPPHAPTNAVPPSNNLEQSLTAAVATEVRRALQAAVAADAATAGPSSDADAANAAQAIEVAELELKLAKLKRQRVLGP